MEIIGRLIQMLPERRGEGARGPWVSGGFVIETEEQFARKVAFDIWGEDRLMAIKSIPIGTTIKVTFTVESREYNDRWYTSCRCTNVETFTSAMPQPPYGQTGQGYQMQSQGYTQPMTQPQMQQQPVQTQMPQQDPQVQYQQPPTTPQSMDGTVEQAPMSEDEDDLPF